MEITCLPLPDNGNKIDSGFICNMTGTGSFANIELVDDGQGNIFFVDKSVGVGDFLVPTLLLFLIVIILGKIIFDFFLPPRIRIKKIL